MTTSQCSQVFVSLCFPFSIQGEYPLHFPLMRQARKQACRLSQTIPVSISVPKLDGKLVKFLVLIQGNSGLVVCKRDSLNDVLETFSDQENKRIMKTTWNVSSTNRRNNEGRPIISSPLACCFLIAYYLPTQPLAFWQRALLEEEHSTDHSCAAFYEYNNR